ncbi:hypothetical protein RHMOL_Rhmol09G0215400 [Rhododendron molle]|uniref:Uncharacterized protein n=1 Tax=Rhododendron molle TaxID=49168 RepID=A0ACC0MFM6_RHOML|nr:hypothetical protein RHMOL_Rhmol09G0215400 [Rhododendron molle]
MVSDRYCIAWFVKAKRELLGGVDKISQLPREILGDILSRLTLEEAGRTSVLSRNWRHRWAFLSTKLNFGAWKSRDERSSLRINICSPWYARRVNQMLKLHRGAFVLDEFIIRFYPEEESRAAYYGDLDRWVNFAFQKGVKRLELDLASDRSRLYRWYAFPSVEKLCSRTSNTHPQLFGFCHLITLCLKCVNITGEAVEHFLGNCPLLEQLQVMSSDHLTNLKVAGPSLKLKWLEISRCENLEDLEISAVNLATLSFTYFGLASRYQSTFPCNDRLEVLSAMPNDDRYVRVAPEYHHRCLQVVELVGFSGHPDEVEFLSYWLVIAVSLDIVEIHLIMVLFLLHCHILISSGNSHNNGSHSPRGANTPPSNPDDGNKKQWIDCRAYYRQMQELRMKSMATVADLRPSKKFIAGWMRGKNGPLKRV